MSFVSNYPPAGSMTRVFTPPCGPITNAGYGPSSFIGEHGHANYASSCGPPGWLDRNAGEFSVGYFSPAICPAGYTAACTWYDVAQGPPPAAGTETAMNCLPSGYACNTAVLRHGTLTAAALGDKKRQEGASTLTEAPYFFIRWRAQDLSVFETHPLSPGVYLVNGIPESTSVSTPASSSSATTGQTTSPSKSSSSSSSSSSSTAIQTDTSPPPSSPSTSSSLSTGAIAGIAVGAIGGVALIAAAAVFVWLRKRRAAARGTHPTVPELHDPKAVPELDAPPQGGGPKELAAAKDPLDPQELALTAAAAELPTERHDQSTPAELSATATSPATRAAYHLSTPPDGPGHGGAGGNDPWTPSPVASTSSPHTATTATATAAYIPTPPPWAPETEPPPGLPPALASDGGSGFAAAHDDELAELRARKAEIDAKRQRLLQLQQLDEEEQGLQRRMRELASGGGSAGNRGRTPGSGSGTGAGMGG